MIKFPGLAWCYAGIVGVAVAVAGCSGGGGGVTAPAPTSPSVTPTPGPTSTAALKQTATLILAFPHGTPPGPKRNYVSPNSLTISVTINLVNGQAPPSWVPTQTTATLVFAGPGQNCTVSNGIATCAITIPAPPGNVAYTITTYAPVIPPSPGPSPTSTNTVLDQVQETIAIKQGVQNQVNVTLQGVVKSAIVTPASPLISGQTSSSVLTITAFDASGAVITGTTKFYGPFKFTDADKYGTNNPNLYPYSTFLEVNGVGPQAKSVQIFSPTDVLTMTDFGAAQGQFKVIANGPGQLGAGPVQGVTNITPVLQPIVLPGIPLDDTAHGGLPTDPNYNQYTLFMHVGDPAYSITPSEVGFTAPSPPFGLCNGKTLAYQCLALADDNFLYTPCNDDHSPPGPVASFNPGPLGQTQGYTYTITPLRSGLCLQQFFDGNSPGHEPAPVGNPLVNGELWVKVQ